jgi:hypothetical protein
MELDKQIDKLLRQFSLEEILDMMNLTEEEVLELLHNHGHELPEVI